MWDYIRDQFPSKTNNANLKMTTNDTKYLVRVGNKLFTFVTSAGLKQGDALGPMLVRSASNFWV